MKTLLSAAFLWLIVTAAKCQQNNPQAIISAELNRIERSLVLKYPNSVKLFYKQNEFKYAWIRPKSDANQFWTAMLLLDCVVQFGLSHKDYHPERFSYDIFRTMINEPKNISEHAKARYDIFLTDALITFINHLHYGKLNPQFTQTRIDIKA